MEMFLTALVLSFLGVAVSFVAFSASVREHWTRDEHEPQGQSVPIGLTALPDDSFFADNRPLGRRAVVPIEALRLQIEHHVRLEQAAAEAFHQRPTHEALHVQTVSPLVH
jgi:hypothetical protein